MNAVRRMLLTLAVLACTATTHAAHFRVGDFAFPKETPSYLKVGNRYVAKVEISNFLIVREVRGEWLWVESRSVYAPDDDGPHGWVRAGAMDTFDEQIEYFRRRAATDVTPNPPDLHYYWLGLICRLSDDPHYQKLAVSYFTRAIVLAPADDLNYYRRGFCWARLEQWDQALADFEQASRLDASDEDYQAAVAYAQSHLDQSLTAPEALAPGDTTTVSLKPAPRSP
ncbi:MAG TPA: hypothetical protein PKC18_01280 [Lacipirellulaceae bacterium]|nr:hypothetical protein [Lacipirellulaceae bacterium]HMP05733.1 hypothetical protein [Lacipirellulaceae bacterium]